MAITDTLQVAPHWNYLLAIEEDVQRLARFIEFDSRNFDCFSVEIARVLLAAAAEVDVVCKQLCRNIDPGSRAGRIDEYRSVITAAWPQFYAMCIDIPRFGLQLTPWEEWGREGGVPLWWTAYNKVKHHRASDYDRAHLKNALNSVAGLFLVVVHLYREKAMRGELLPSPRLLRPAVQHMSGTTYSGYEFGINYLIPSPVNGMREPHVRSPIDSGS